MKMSSAGKIWSNSGCQLTFTSVEWSMLSCISSTQGLFTSSYAMIWTSLNKSCVNHSRSWLFRVWLKGKLVSSSLTDDTWQRKRLKSTQMLKFLCNGRSNRSQKETVWLQNQWQKSMVSMLSVPQSCLEHLLRKTWTLIRHRFSSSFNTSIVSTNLQIKCNKDIRVPKSLKH